MSTPGLKYRLLHRETRKHCATTKTKTVKLFSMDRATDTIGIIESTHFTAFSPEYRETVILSIPRNLELGLLLGESICAQDTKILL